MNALLSFLQKLLFWVFAMAFGVLVVVAALRYRGGSGDEDEAPWKQAKAENSVEAYLSYLNQCQSCPHEQEAERALDAAQRERGLVSRLARGHLAVRASISLPVFSPDGRTVLAAGGSGIDFWDANTGAVLPHDDNAFQRRGGRYIESLAYSPDGQRIAAGLSGTESGSLAVWGQATGELLADYFVEWYDVKQVEFASDGTRVGWLAHGPAGIWEPATGRLLRANHEGASAMAFTRVKGGRELLLTASGRELWLWDPATMERVRQAEIKSDRTLLGLSRDGRLAGYYEGRVLELWDSEAAAVVATLTDHDDEVESFCRDTKNGWVAVGTKAGTLYLWDPSTAKLLGKVPAHEGPVEQLGCSGKGWAATVGWDSAKVWDLEKLRRWREKQAKTRRHR